MSLPSIYAAYGLPSPPPPTAFSRSHSAARAAMPAKKAASFSAGLRASAVSLPCDDYEEEDADSAAAHSASAHSLGGTRRMGLLLSG